MFLQMSDNLFSDEEMVPPSRPNVQSIVPIYMCRKRKRVEETVEYISPESDQEYMSSESDEEPLDQIKKRRCQEWIQNAKPGSSKTQNVQTQSASKPRSSKTPNVQTQSASTQGSSKTTNVQTQSESSKKNKVRPKKKAVPPKRKVVPPQKRIRERKKCNDCGKFQKNIWRHMQRVHGTYNSRVERKVVSPRGYVTRICPITRPKKCWAIVERLRDHLIRTHKIDNGSEKLKALMKKAKPVIKESEEYEETEETEQPMVKIKKEDSSPSTLNVIEISSDEEVTIKKEHESEVDEETEQPMVKTKKQTSSSSKSKFRKKKGYDVIEINSSEGDDTIKEENESQVDEDPILYSDDEIQYRGRAKIHYDPTQKMTDQDKEVNDEYFGPTQKAQTSCEEENNVIASESKENDKDGKDDSKHEKEDSEDTNVMFFRDKRIVKFVGWLQKPPSFKSRRTAMQHGAQAFHVWYFMDPNRSIQGLLAKKRLDEWVHKVTDKKAPGTINSYIGSVVQLVNYLLDDKKISGLEVESAMRFKQHINLTSKLLGKRIRIRRTIIETEELGKLICLHFNKVHIHTRTR